MMLKRFGILCLAIASVAAEAISGFRCGNEEATPENIETAKKLAKLERLRDELGLPLHPRKDATSLTISTYFHYVSKYDKPREMEERFKLAGKVLNDAYQPYGIQFDIHKLVHHYRVTWTKGNDIFEMKKALRLGDYKTLNIYFIDGDTIDGQPVLGHCPFPDIDARWNDTRVSDDGCVIRAATIPGMPKREDHAHLETLTTVHEVGHWLGLFHPFQTGCDGDDKVQDTPPSAKALRGCPVGSQTCGQNARFDQIHNYMSYTSNECKTEFTLGQSKRMHETWWAIRSPVPYRENWSR